MENIRYKRKISLPLRTISVVLSIFLLAGCRTNEGVFVPFVGTSYDASYLQSLRSERTEEPLYNVVIEDEAAAIKLYGSVESAKTFESYFPDDIEGGKELDKWWKSPLKSFRSDREIIRTVRHGLRKSKEGKRFMIRWFCRHFGRPRSFVSKYSLEAYDLMYYASFSPDKDARHSAIYFGISGGWCSPKIRKRYLQLSMDFFEEVDSTVKIAKTNESFKNEMLMYLEPYLNSSEAKVRQRAILFEKFFTGETDYRKWRESHKIELN